MRMKIWLLSTTMNVWTKIKVSLSSERLTCAPHQLVPGREMRGGLGSQILSKPQNAFSPLLSPFYLPPFLLFAVFFGFYGIRTTKCIFFDFFFLLKFYFFFLLLSMELDRSEMVGQEITFLASLILKLENYKSRII